MPDRFPEILVMGRGTVERYQPGPGEVCISIRSPGMRFPSLSPAFAAVLGLEFADYPWSTAETHLHTISEHDAMRVARFVEDFCDTARVIVVHCEVGASRSPSVALAIRQAYRCAAPVRVYADGKREPVVGRIPNRSVYVRVGRACMATGDDAGAPPPGPPPLRSGDQAGRPNAAPAAEHVPITSQET